MSTNQPMPSLSPATIPGAMQFDLASKASGRTYRIYISEPNLPPPPEGYPVVYVADGDSLFGTAAAQGFLRQLELARQPLIVGIGYGDPNPFAPLILRNHDLTPPTLLENIPATLAASPILQGATFGGADDFFRFLTEELRPVLASFKPINPNDQTLFGDSLGGLFVLHVLFNHPGAFKSFVAASPSIWWNGQSVLDDEGKFAAAVAGKSVVPRVLITVGELEQSTAPDLLPADMSIEAATDLITSARMVDNARELAQRLSGITGGDGYVVRFHRFEGETHGSVVPAAVSRAISFALAR